MPAPNFMFPQPNMFGTNPYQQLLQQYQQNVMNQPMQQQRVVSFIVVPSEEVARKSDVPPNSSASFINENEGYVYKKTVGMSILEPYEFERYRLVKDEDTKEQKQIDSPPAVDMSGYITKEEFEPYKTAIQEMQKIAKELNGDE